MRHISLREANQKFSACIADVERGEHLVVERRGVPVAEIIPFRRPLGSAKRDKAWKELMALLEKGIPLGGQAFSRDEMHER